MSASKMLNIGCGANYHPDWINLDVSAFDSSVLEVDINDGLPFSSEFAAACYCSHVLEHLDKVVAKNLVDECFRVLKCGGVIRLVLPDLEALTREYLSILDTVTSGDVQRDLDYDWIMLELYDQAVRDSSGGEMTSYLAGLDEDHKAYVRLRIGDEAKNFWSPKQALSSRSRPNTLVSSMPWRRLLKLFRLKLAGWLVYLTAGKTAFRSFRKGIFRDSGEVHQWMYDRYSLKRMLNQAGFVDVKICGANESRIPGFEKYSLDVLDGIVRKPDSLYVEAAKP
jgi:SAM-dependent methyltransferase